MRTLIEVVQLSKSYVGQARPSVEVEEWIAHCLGMIRFDLYINHDIPVEERELKSIRSGLRLLREGRPLAYITGKAPFWKNEFFVNASVLIPRPETEILVEKAIEYCKSEKTTSVVDVCTGTGCVGISLKRELPALSVMLFDLSPCALEVARKNGEGLDLVYRQGDLLEPLASNEVDLVVANPPYLSVEEWEKADLSVRGYEPKQALVGGVRGDELYARLFGEAKQKKVRALFVEIGASQGEVVQQLAFQAGAREVRLFLDLSQKPRVVFVRFE